jgi:hypothetical protein
MAQFLEMATGKRPLGRCGIDWVFCAAYAGLVFMPV